MLIMYEADSSVDLGLNDRKEFMLYTWGFERQILMKTK